MVGEQVRKKYECGKLPHEERRQSYRKEAVEVKRSPGKRDVGERSGFVMEIPFAGGNKHYI